MTPANDFFNRLEGTWENKINGEWVDQFGWNIITQPMRNNPSMNDFKIRVDPMREQITFRKIGQARNIGTTGEAGFWQSMAYEVAIENTEGEGIHHEMGHFLLKVKEDGETQQSLSADIIRHGTIPRANSFMSHGKLLIGSIAQVLQQQQTPFYSSRATMENPQLQEKFDNELLGIQEMVTESGGPNLDQPLEWLVDILKEEVIGTDWVFSFRDNEASEMSSGQRVPNPVSIGNLLSDFWIGDRSTEHGELRILQYTQKVDLRFNSTDWPHVAINTLIKQ